VLVFATTAHAGVIELAIVPQSSQLGIKLLLSDPALPGGPVTFGKVTTYPVLPSDSTKMTPWGAIYMDYTPGVSLAMSGPRGKRL
jgi:hypothetical protein